MSRPTAPNGERESKDDESKLDELRRRYHLDKPSQPGDHASTKEEQQTLMRLASAGFELASFSLILGGLGYSIDYWISSATPYFAIVGLLLGFSLGFYRLILLASRLS